LCVAVAALCVQVLTMGCICVHAALHCCHQTAESKLTVYVVIYMVTQQLSK
jgi:hypothetical protein